MAPAHAGATLELDDTAFFPQQEFQCGPAALAMLLDASAVSVTPQRLVPMVYLPDRHGSLQAEIIAASRRFDRLPYVIDPEFDALLDELAAGRPVLVLQNLGVAFAPAWHYAVVIGYSAPRGEVVLRSGVTERLTQPARSFLRTWSRSGSWGLVLLKPGEIPDTVVADRYLRAAAAAESAARFDLAIASYRAALRRWPEASLAYLGLGNAHHGKGELEAAEYWYRQYIGAGSGTAPVGVNNLASVLTELGRCAEARGLIGEALRDEPADSAARPLLEATALEAESCPSVSE